jgi:predicted AAA+ superfamily ATPase
VAVLRTITETCEPRADVLAGGLTDAHFAAQLDQVVRSPEKYPVYGDPTEFFAITFPTKGLRDLLSSTFGRLSGQAGHVEGAEHGVVRFQTSFGGGKTHGLIAAYHLAQGARPIGVEEFVDPSLLPDVCRVAAVVGDSLDPLSGLEVNGHRVQTMWGAIAAQLGDEAWETVGPLDAERSAPGTDVWEKIFETSPTLVIIDEIAAHLRMLSSSGNEDVRRQSKAIPAFLYSLFTAAARVDTARVVITLATAQDAFGDETSLVEKTLSEATESSADTKSVIDRFREILVPAEDDEIAEILRRRLFVRIDEDAAIRAGAQYHELYGEMERRQLSLGMDPDIAGQVTRSYPLHPELVKVLDSRVGTIPEFQRTRGALRLLAETVAALWDQNTKAVVINATMMSPAI